MTEAERRWETARQVVASEISTAAFAAWISSLRLIGGGHPGRPDGQKDQAGSDAPVRSGEAAGAAAGAGSDASSTDSVVLGCESEFQRQQVERRYRPLLERALGAQVELRLLSITNDNVN